MAKRVQEMDLHGCAGCFGCWIKTPGECAQHDDGALLCRTAKFEGKPVAWNIELYPMP